MPRKKGWKMSEAKKTYYRRVANGEIVKRIDDHGCSLADPSRSSAVEGQNEPFKEESDGKDESSSNENRKMGLLEQPVVLEEGKKRERKKVEKMMYQSPDTERDKVEIKPGKGSALIPWSYKKKNHQKRERKAVTKAARASPHKKKVRPRGLRYGGPRTPMGLPAHDPSQGYIYPVALIQVLSGSRHIQPLSSRHKPKTHPPQGTSLTLDQPVTDTPRSNPSGSFKLVHIFPEGMVQPTSDMNIQQSPLEGMVEPPSDINIQQSPPEGMAQPSSDMNIQQSPFEGMAQPPSDMNIQQSLPEGMAQPPSDMNIQHSPLEGMVKFTSDINIQQSLPEGMAQPPSDMNIQQSPLVGMVQPTSDINIQQSPPEGMAQPPSDMNIQQSPLVGMVQPTSDINIQQSPPEGMAQLFSDINIQQPLPEGMVQPFSDINIQQSLPEGMAQPPSDMNIQQSPLEGMVKSTSDINIQQSPPEGMAQPPSDINIQQSPPEGMAQPPSDMNIQQSPLEGMIQPTSDINIQGFPTLRKALMTPAPSYSTTVATQTPQTGHHKKKKRKRAEHTASQIPPASPQTNRYWVPRTPIWSHDPSKRDVYPVALLKALPGSQHIQLPSFRNEPYPNTHQQQIPSLNFEQPGTSPTCSAIEVSHGSKKENQLINIEPNEDTNESDNHVIEIDRDEDTNENDNNVIEVEPNPQPAEEYSLDDYYSLDTYYTVTLNSYRLCVYHSCLFFSEGHHKKKQKQREREAKSKVSLGSPHKMGGAPHLRYGGPHTPMGSPTHDPSQGNVYPVALSQAGSQHIQSLRSRLEPCPNTHPQQTPSLNFEQPGTSSTDSAIKVCERSEIDNHVIKKELDEDANERGTKQIDTSTTGNVPSFTSAISNENTNELRFSDTQSAEGRHLETSLSLQIPTNNSGKMCASEPGNLRDDPNVHVKVEANLEYDIELNRVELGQCSSIDQMRFSKEALPKQREATESSSSELKFTDTQPVEGCNSDSSNLVSVETSLSPQLPTNNSVRMGASRSDKFSDDSNVKVEPITESEMELMWDALGHSSTMDPLSFSKEAWPAQVRATGSPEDMQEYMKADQPPRKYKCDSCEEAYKLMLRLLEFRTLHPDDIPCRICGQKLSYTGPLCA